MKIADEIAHLKNQVHRELRTSISGLKEDVRMLYNTRSNLLNRMDTLEKVIAANGFQPGDVVDSYDQYGDDAFIGRVLINQAVGEGEDPFARILGEYHATILDGEDAGGKVIVSQKGRILTRRASESVE